MTDIVFVGKVVPERAELNISEPTRVEVHDQNGEIYTWNIHIYKNQILVHLIYPDHAQRNFQDLAIQTEEFVNSIVNLGGYIYGIGYDVEMTSVFHKQTGEVVVFGRDLPVTRNEPKNRAKKFNLLTSAIAKSPIVPVVLADLRAAIRYPSDAAVHSYRAFESIFGEFHSDGDNQSTALRKMASDLNLGSGKKLRSFLGKLAAPRRHGKPVVISWEDRKAVMRRIWLVTDRYMEYLIRDRKPLPKSKYPVPKKY